MGRSYRMGDDIRASFIPEKVGIDDHVVKQGIVDVLVIVPRKVTFSAEVFLLDKGDRFFSAELI